jgi:hypothetical protein
MAIPLPASPLPLPPRKVEYARPDPAGLNLETKALVEPPTCFAWMGWEVGKSEEVVCPVT